MKRTTLAADYLPLKTAEDKTKDRSGDRFAGTLVPSSGIGTVSQVGKFPTCGPTALVGESIRANHLVNG